MNQLASFGRNMFGDIDFRTPSTQGVKYAGSKLRLLPHILSLLAETGARHVLDGFSGTTRVSQALAKLGCRVIASDISPWSEVFATCYLKAGRSERYRELIDHLNGVEPEDGWFTSNYGGDPNAPDGCKRPWQMHNTRRLDAIRSEIDRLDLDVTSKAVALTSLILALDKVDSTLGHYSSYLKEWAPRSYGDLHLKLPETVETDEDHEVLQGDILDVAEKVHVDAAYLDPPYGSNNERMPPSRVRYASYYHLWATIVRNDEPELFGSANRRADSRDTVAASVFEEFRKDENGDFLAINAVGDLIEKLNARYVILSYGSGGQRTAEGLHDCICRHGQLLKVREVDYRRNVMSSMSWTGEWTRDAGDRNVEFLFLLDKG